MRGGGLRMEMGGHQCMTRRLSLIGRPPPLSLSFSLAFSDWLLWPKRRRKKEKEEEEEEYEEEGVDVIENSEILADRMIAAAVFFSLLILTVTGG